MPVGNSDKGVGLWAGQVMLGLDNNAQYIDWWHEELEDESFDHSGTLSTFLLQPRLTIGLSNYWNLSVSTTLGNRYMDWRPDTSSKHHRDEGSLDDYDNAHGGYLGDSEIMLRYLVLNVGGGTGSRFFIGGGLIIPSKNALTSDPYFLAGGNIEDHRHFSMSEGTYKAIIEMQLFKKNMKNPVFIGGVFKVLKPIGENEYGFKSSTITSLSLSALTKNIAILSGAISTNFRVQNATPAFWNGHEAPNSKGTELSYGLGYIKNSDVGTFGVMLQKPVYVSGGLASDEGGIDQSSNTWTLAVSYRKILSYTLPGFD